MSELLLNRKWFTDTSTIGELSIDDLYECFTLEDKVRAPGYKIPTKTAVPAGRYALTVDKSERFQKYMFHVVDVPMFDGIRIHSGNTDIDTDGCILVGGTKGVDLIGGSKDAFKAIWDKLTVLTGTDKGVSVYALKEPCFITIVDSPVSDTRTPDNNSLTPELA